MKSLLENIFSSKTRTKMLNLFLLNPGQEFYVRELTRKLDERINSIRRELFNLEKIGLLKSHEKDRKKFYIVNKNFVAFSELKSLISRVNTEPKKKSFKDIENLGKVRFACYSGFFTQSPSKVDFLLVGEVNRRGVEQFVKKLEREQEKEVNYTIMSENEFIYRRDLGDRFLKSILDNEYIELINMVQKKNTGNVEGV